LKDLVEQGHRLVIVSNLPQKIADRLVDKFLLRRYFALVVGGDLLPVCKPDPGHLLYAVECSGGDIAGALLIADSLSDIKAAKSASIPVIAFPRDQKTKLLMDKFHPEMFIDAIHEIPDAMEQLMENSMY
jgi:phosphoglycolate phosphatase